MFLSSHVENDGSAALTSKALIDMSFSNCVYKNEEKKQRMRPFGGTMNSAPFLTFGHFFFFCLAGFENKFLVQHMVQ